jgi:hypothetical protein
VGQVWAAKVEGTTISIENPVYKMADGKEITISTTMIGKITAGTTTFESQKFGATSLSLWGPIGEKATGISKEGDLGKVLIDTNGAVTFQRVKFNGQAQVSGPMRGGSTGEVAAPLNKDLAFLNNKVTVTRFDAKTNLATIDGEFMVHTDSSAGDVAVGFGIGTQLQMDKGVVMRMNGVDYFQNRSDSFSKITVDRGFVPGQGVAGKIVGRQETLIFGEAGTPWIRVVREIDTKDGTIYLRPTMALSGEPCHGSVDKNTGILHIDAVGKEKAQLILTKDQLTDKTSAWHGILTSGENTLVGNLFKIAEKSPFNPLRIGQEDILTGKAVVKKTIAVLSRNVVALAGVGEMAMELGYAKVTGDFKPISTQIEKWERMDNFISKTDTWIESSRALMGEQKGALVRAAQAGGSLMDVELQSFKMAVMNMGGGLASGGVEATRKELSDATSDFYGAKLTGGTAFLHEQVGGVFMLVRPDLTQSQMTAELSGGDWRKEKAAGRVAMGETVATTGMAAFLTTGVVKGFRGGYGKVGSIQNAGGKFSFKLNPASERIFQGTKGASLEMFDMMSPVGHDLLDVNRVLVPMVRKAHFELSGSNTDLKSAGFTYRDADRVAYNRDTNTFVLDMDAGATATQVTRVIEGKHNAEIGSTAPHVVENAFANKSLTAHLTDDSVRNFKGQVDNVIQDKNQTITENTQLRKEARQEATAHREKRAGVEEVRKEYGIEQDRLRALKNKFEKGEVSANDVERQIGEIVSGKHPSRQEIGPRDRSGIVEGTGQGRQGTGESGQRNRQNHQNVEKGDLQNRETPEIDQRGPTPKSDIDSRIGSVTAAGGREAAAGGREAAAGGAIKDALQEVGDRIQRLDTRIAELRSREDAALGRADQYRERIDEARADVRTLKKVGDALEKRLKQGEPQGPVRLALYLEDDTVAANLLTKYRENLIPDGNRGTPSITGFADDIHRLVANERGHIAVGAPPISKSGTNTPVKPPQSTSNPNNAAPRAPPTSGETMPNDLGFKNNRSLNTNEFIMDYGPNRPNQFLKDQTPAVPQAQDLTSESGPTNLANRTYKVGDKLPDGRVAGDGPGTPSATQMDRPDPLLLEYKNKGQKALTYNPEPVYTRKYTQSLRSFQEDVKPVVEKYGMTVDEFYRFMPERAETLTVKQRARMIAIRESVPKPTPDTLLEKVIPQADIPKYLDGNYTTIQGFVNRAQDVKGVKNPFDTYQSLRLDYEGTTFNPYKDQGIGVIRFKTAEVERAVIPFSDAMGGKSVVAYPNTGNGFTAAENGRVIPEFVFPKTNSSKGISPRQGAELYEVTRTGAERLRAVYDSRQKRFVPVNQ